MEKTIIKETEKNAKLHRWATEIKEFQESGMTIRNFCKMKGMHHSTYYHHLRAVQQTFLQADKDAPTPLAKCESKPIFVKVPFDKEENKVALVKNGHEDSSGSICIHIKGVSIEIPENATFELIGKVLMAVKES